MYIKILYPFMFSVLSFVNCKKKLWSAIKFIHLPPLDEGDVENDDNGYVYNTDDDAGGWIFFNFFPQEVNIYTKKYLFRNSHFWYCPNPLCCNLNYASRVACNRCKALNAGAALYMQQAATMGYAMQASVWFWVGVGRHRAPPATRSDPGDQNWEGREVLARHQRCQWPPMAAN